MNANEKLIHATISHELDLRRYSDSVVYRIIAVLNRSDSAMAAELVVKLESMSPTAFSIERLEGMLYSVRQLNAQAFADVQRELTQELRDFAQYEAAWNQAVLADVLPAKIMAVGVSVDQVAAAALSRPFQGNLLKGFLSELEEKKARLIRQAVADGFVQGKTTADIVRSIRGTKAKGYSDGIIEITRRDAQAIVRTALSHTAAAATRKTHEANSDLIKGFVWLATLDQRTSSQCRIRDHKQYDKAHKPIGHSYPWGAGPGAFHWCCFPAGTLVTASSNITGVYKRWFEGDLVIIRTAGNRLVSCTPNHPILTDRGWVAAECINKSDKVACDGGSQWVGVGDNDSNDVPSLIENVVESFLVSGGVRTMEMPVSAPDFHGDGAGSNVAVIGSNRGLFTAIKTEGPQHFDKVSFVGGRALAPVPVPRNSAFGQFFDTSSSSGCCLVRFLREPFYLLRGGVCHASKLLLASVTRGLSRSNQMPSNNSVGCTEPFCNSFEADARIVQADNSRITQGDEFERCVAPILSENSCDDLLCDGEGSSDRVNGFASVETGEHQGGVNIMDVSTDADSSIFKQSCHGDVTESDLASNLLGGKTGSVFLDDVISIERTRFSGHVFNLETELGFYTANGIISHNCRSKSTPILKSLKEITGLDIEDFEIDERASMDGVVPGATDYATWIKKQSAARQDDVLGKSRAELLRKGDLSLADLYSAKGSPLTLDQLRERHAAAFKKAGL